MYLIVFLGGILIGSWICGIWGNHRAKYWQKQCEKIIRKADAVNAANVQLLEVAKRVEKYERGTNLEKMRVGLTEAIARMSEDNAGV